MARNAGVNVTLVISLEPEDNFFMVEVILRYVLHHYCRLS